MNAEMIKGPPPALSHPQLSFTVCSEVSRPHP